MSHFHSGDIDEDVWQSYIELRDQILNVLRDIEEVLVIEERGIWRRIDWRGMVPGDGLRRSRSGLTKQRRMNCRVVGVSGVGAASCWWRLAEGYTQGMLERVVGSRTGVGLRRVSVV